MVSMATIEITPEYGVQVNRDLVDMIEALPAGKYRLIIEPFAEPASVPQRRLMYMWFAHLAWLTGSTKREVHDYYCSKFLDDFKPSTINMSNLQLTHFMKQIQADAMVEFDVRLPDPDDKEAYHHFIREYKHR